MCPLVLVLLAVFVSCSAQNGTSLCDVPDCFCQSDSAESDFPTLNVDCSFSKPSVLKEVHSLPENVSVLDLSVSNVTSLRTIESLLRSLSLTKLYLDRNQLEEIPSGVLQLPSLVYLDLSDNVLSSFDSHAFEELKSLSFLNLASNRIQSFAPETFRNLKSLNALILDDNELGDYLIETNIFQEDGPALNSKIEELSFENIGLKVIPDNFVADAYNLRHWSLARNSLTVLPELPFTLNSLDLSDNPITELDDEDFSNTPALKELILNNLYIKEVPEYTFAALKALEKLELIGNRRLKRFDRLAFGAEVLDDADDFVLKSLSLRGNLLSTLDGDLQEPLSQLSELDLQGNPWICDCRVAWIRQLNISEEKRDHIRCFRPLPAYNSRLFEVEADKFICKPHLESYQRVAGYLVIGVSLILTASALWVYVVMPRRYSRGNVIAPSSPYSRITVENNDLR